MTIEQQQMVQDVIIGAFRGSELIIDSCGGWDFINEAWPLDRASLMSLHDAYNEVRERNREAGVFAARLNGMEDRYS